MPHKTEKTQKIFVECYGEVSKKNVATKGNKGPLLFGKLLLHFCVGVRKLDLSLLSLDISEVKLPTETHATQTLWREEFSTLKHTC